MPKRDSAISNRLLILLTLLLAILLSCGALAFSPALQRLARAPYGVRCSN